VLSESHALPANSEDEAIVATQNGGCAGCAAYQACTFFPAAAQSAPTPCNCTTPPSEEQVTQLAPNMVGFEDPPGFVGDAEPSGGEYPANAVMTYNQNQDGGGTSYSSWFETCTLPYDQQTTCTAVLNDFASRYKNS
jgi:hypothetical protein